MRTRFLFLGGGATLIAAAVVVEACGGDTDATTPPTGSDGGGADAVADTGAKDTAPPVEEDTGAPCDKTNDFLKDIPDAAIADGGSTTGICVGCAKQNCGTEIEACKQDCPCQGIAADALECYLQNPDNPLICAGQFGTVPKETQNIGLALISCISGKCEDECQTKRLTQDAGDGG